MFEAFLQEQREARKKFFDRRGGDGGLLGEESASARAREGEWRRHAPGIGS